MVGLGFDSQVDFLLILDPLGVKNQLKIEQKINQKSDAIFNNIFAPFLVGFGSQNGFENPFKEAKIRAIH